MVAQWVEQQSHRRRDHDEGGDDDERGGDDEQARRPGVAARATVEGLLHPEPEQGGDEPDEDPRDHDAIPAAVLQVEGPEDRRDDTEHHRGQQQPPPRIERHDEHGDDGRGEDRRCGGQRQAVGLHRALGRLRPAQVGDEHDRRGDGAERDTQPEPDFDVALRDPRQAARRLAGEERVSREPADRAGEHVQDGDHEQHVEGDPEEGERGAGHEVAGRLRLLAGDRSSPQEPAVVAQVARFCRSAVLVGRRRRERWRQGCAALVVHDLRRRPGVATAGDGREEGGLGVDGVGVGRRRRDPFGLQPLQRAESEGRGPDAAAREGDADDGLIGSRTRRAVGVLATPDTSIVREPLSQRRQRRWDVGERAVERGLAGGAHDDAREPAERGADERSGGATGGGDDEHPLGDGERRRGDGVDLAHLTVSVDHPPEEHVLDGVERTGSDRREQQPGGQRADPLAVGEPAGVPAPVDEGHDVDGDEREPVATEGRERVALVLAGRPPVDDLLCRRSRPGELERDDTRVPVASRVDLIDVPGGQHRRGDECEADQQEGGERPRALGDGLREGPLLWLRWGDLDRCVHRCDPRSQLLRVHRRRCELARRQASHASR